MMLLVDSTFISRGFGGIAQDNRDFVLEFRNYRPTKFLFDKNFDQAVVDGIKLPKTMRTVNAQALLLNKTIQVTEWGGSFFQTHLTGLGTPNRSNSTFLRLHDIFPLSNPEWFTWRGQRIFKIAAKSLSPNTVLICNSVATQMAAKMNPEFSKFESMVVPCRIMKMDNSYIPCGTCEYCIRGLTATEFLLAVGTIEPRKNYERLIEGWESSQKKSDFRNLVIVGRPGWKSQNIQRKIKQNKTVIWVSPCDFGLQKIFFSANGFISASLAEGFDIPSVFAQKLGIPSAISSIEAHKEFCPDAQIFFNPNSEIEITDAIKMLKASDINSDLDYTSMDWHEKFDKLIERIGLQRKF